jgi:hypothetical protein
MLHNPEFTRRCAGQNQSIVIQSAALFDIVNAGPKAAQDAMPRAHSCIAHRRRETGPDHFNTFTQRLQNENQPRPAEGDKGVHPQRLDVPLPPQKLDEAVNAGTGSRDVW